MSSNVRLRLLEFALWVGVVSGAIVTVSLVVGLVVGGDLVIGKFILFVVGFLIFGVASLLIQPSRPGKAGTSGESSPVEVPRTSVSPGWGAGRASDQGITPDLGTIREQLGLASTHEHRFEATLQEIGPLADHHLPFEQRIGRGYKLFATSLVVLAFSFGMELAGIHV